MEKKIIRKCNVCDWVLTEEEFNNRKAKNPKIFPSNVVNNHKQKHKPKVICGDCNQEFTRQSNLNVHKKRSCKGELIKVSS